MRFTHLHVHSHYSLLDGLSKIDGIVEKAKKLNHDAIALTDHGVLYGAVEFYQKATKAGIKPILGVEAYIAPNGRHNKRAGIDTTRYHLILLAKNNAGWHNLIRLVNLSHLEGFYYKPRMDKELLKQYSEGIVCLSACLAGEVSRKLRDGTYDEAKTAALEYQNIFGKENFFLEIGSHPNIPNSDTVSEKIISLSKELSIPLVATQDSHYTDKDDAEAHDVLLAVQTGNQLSDEDRLTLKDDDFSLCSTENMMERFKATPEAIENTARVADMCNVKLKLGVTQLPKFNLPKNETANSHLRTLAKAGLKNVYPAITTEIQKRFEYEIGIIEKTGFADYFLIVQDFVNWAKNHGIVVGPGRGSAAGSIVSYALNITEVDPLKYGLLFERFLNPDRIQMPDIDIDITDVRRDEVIAYIKEMYGEGNVAQIITFGTMAARAAIRDAGRALGYPYGFCDTLAKLIPFNNKLGEALAGVVELSDLYENNGDAKRIIDAAKRMEGVVRHASVHACGLVISKDPLFDFIPMQRAPQDDTNMITQFEMHSIEALGLLKMDLLGLRNLTIIEESIRVIQEHAGKNIDMKKIPLDDKKTYKLLQNAETIGVFQLESEGMRRYIRELKPTEFEDIIAMISLYRPGPIELIPQYIARKHGKEPIHYLHEKLKPILEKTYGIAVYQEQLMQIARDLGGFTLSEADVLRKAVGKKIRSLLDEQSQKLIEGMIKNGIDEMTAKRIWHWFEPFAQYGFNKSHGAAYATIGYQTAYLKANYPLEFMTSLFRAESKETERTAFLISEAKRMNIEVLAPDINQSTQVFAIDTGAKTPSIRFGLSAIKNVGGGIVDAITEERHRNGPFKTLEEFLTRIQHKDLNKKSLESLIKCGAFDSLGIERGNALSNMEEILKFNSQTKRAGATPQGGLFETMDYEVAKLNLKDMPPAPDKERLSWEKELLGFYLSDHPLTLHREQIIAERAATIDQVMQKKTGRFRIAGVVAKINRITTKAGKPMLFVRVEDLSSSIEVIVFTSTLEENPGLWEEENVLMIDARPSTRNGEFKLICQSAQLL